MNAIYLLLPIALLLVTTMITLFIRAARRGEFDDLETPAHRMLLDDEEMKTERI